MKWHHFGWMVLAAAVAGCSGKPDTASARKADQSPIAGADAGYTATGWKAGDAESWNQHMRARAQNQNEYARTQQVSR